MHPGLEGITLSTNPVRPQLQTEMIQEGMPQLQVPHPFGPFSIGFSSATRSKKANYALPRSKGAQSVFDRIEKAKLAKLEKQLSRIGISDQEADKQQQ
jgi:hypothetical protein